jgi:hypothetical protein
MADDLLDRIRGEIRDRLRLSRAAYEESQRLEAALAALGERSARQATAASSRRAPRRVPRAPRGENRRRIRDVVEQRPGASAGEIAGATGIARATVASTLGKLAREGELEKTQLPGGAVGYRRAREQRHQPPASNPQSDVDERDQQHDDPGPPSAPTERRGSTDSRA